MKDGDSDGIVPVTDSEEEAEKAREEFLAFARKKCVLLPPQLFVYLINVKPIQKLPQCAAIPSHSTE